MTHKQRGMRLKDSMQSVLVVFKMMTVMMMSLSWCCDI